MSKRSSEGLPIRRFRRWDASPSTIGRTTSWTALQGKPGTRTAKGTPVLTARYAKASMSGRRAGRFLLRNRSEALLISSFQAASSSVMGRVTLWTHPQATLGSAGVTGSLRGLPALAATSGCLGRWPRRCSPECELPLPPARRGPSWSSSGCPACCSISGCAWLVDRWVARAHRCREPRPASFESVAPLLAGLD